MDYIADYASIHPLLLYTKAKASFDFAELKCRNCECFMMEFGIVSFAKKNINLNNYTNLFAIACAYGQLNLIKYCLEKFSNKAGCSYHYYYSNIESIENYITITEILSKMCIIDYEQQILRACNSNWSEKFSIEVVKYLLGRLNTPILTNGQNVLQSKNPNRLILRNQISVACCFNKYELAKILADNAEWPNDNIEDHYSNLFILACFHGDFPTAKRICDIVDSAVEIVGAKYFGNAIFAARLGKHKQIIKLIKERCSHNIATFDELRNYKVPKCRKDELFMMLRNKTMVK
jgi:hypothetical protein